MENWATNVTFHDSQTYHPKSVNELAEIIASNEKVRARGSGHCFNTAADSYETVVVLDALPKEIKFESDSVIVSAGMNYAEVAERIDAKGLALRNLASLPHISVVGAMATGTHGSGIKNGALHTSARSYEIIDAQGQVRTINKADPDFYSALVGIGSTGIITSVELEVEPTYSVAQTVYAELPHEVFKENLLEIMSGGYSVNYFTDFTNSKRGDLWFKSRGENPDSYFGAQARKVKVHPLIAEPADATTEQCGIPGPWHKRLCQFRIDANPSAGLELQSEFFVESKNAVAAFSAIEEIAPEFGDKLMISEIRAIAADDHWMSPAYQRESISLHCTWKSDFEVPYLIHLIEEALAPFSFRPHLGKLFNVETGHFQKVLPKFNDFVQYVKKVDPTGKFQNKFSEELLGL